MSTDVLTLAQLLSPSFPIGAFAYSHGLERAIHDGVMSTAQEVQDWLHDLLMHGGAFADAVLLNTAATACAADIKSIDTAARAFAASKERLLEIDLQGAAFCETVFNVWGHELGRLAYPVAVGRSAQLMTLDTELTTALYLQATVSNLCAAAMRLVPLGQTDGQRIMAALKPICLAQAQAALGSSLNDLHSNTFLSDIAAMRHETQYSRIFRT